MPKKWQIAAIGLATLGIGYGIYTVLAKKPSIAISVSQGGTTSPTPSTIQGNIGDSLEIIAIPDQYYQVSTWVLDGTVVQSGTNTYTFIFDGLQHSLIVNFTAMLSTIVCGWGTVTLAQLEEFHKMGDVNRDGIVDILDSQAMDLALDSDPTKANWNPDCDFNGDGYVNVIDLTTLNLNWGRTACEVFAP